MNSLTVQFYMLDVTNPDAVEWMKNIIKNETLSKAGSSGFMCDFGEYLPFDAELYSKEDAKSAHNKYPVLWAKLVSEAIEEMNESDDLVFFMRSGYTHSSLYSNNNIFWLGDQLISYDGFDGMKTLIPAALSVGLSGMAWVHSDIGGYNSLFSNSSSGMYFVRDGEILMRWTEFAAFGSSLFRTHVGSSMSSVNAQVYDSEESLKHFRKFSMIYGNLSEYRFELMDIAISSGRPLMCPMIAFYFYDPEVLLLSDPPDQYMFGSEFLVSPTVTSKEIVHDVYIPSFSSWIHLWSGNSIVTQASGLYLQIPSPIGFPVVLFKEDSAHGRALRSFVIENGLSVDYSWDYGSSSNSSSNSNKSNDSLTFELTLSLCITVAIITGIILYRVRYYSLHRNKYEKISTSEILSPLSESDRDRNEEGYSLNYS